MIIFEVFIKLGMFAFQRRISSDKVQHKSIMGDQEFTVRIPPRDKKKNYHIMKFNANLKVDAGKWSQVSISPFTQGFTLIYQALFSFFAY